MNARPTCLAAYSENPRIPRKPVTQEESSGEYVNKKEKKDKKKQESRRSTSESGTFAPGQLV